MQELRKESAKYRQVLWEASQSKERDELWKSPAKIHPIALSHLSTPPHPPHTSLFFVIEVLELDPHSSSNIFLSSYTVPNSLSGSVVVMTPCLIQWASSAFGEGIITGQSIGCVPYVKHAVTATWSHLQGLWESLLGEVKGFRSVCVRGKVIGNEIPEHWSTVLKGGRGRYGLRPVQRAALSP